MNELKNKILILLISTLSVSLIIILFTFNIGIYYKEYNDILDKAKVAGNVKSRYNNFNPMFIENDIYEIIFDNNSDIKKIISYSPNGLSDDEVIEIVNQNIDKIYDNKIGLLYTSDYVFQFGKNDNLFMISSTNVKSYLINELIKSIFIFVLLETIIVLSSIKIVKWIVKPVDDSFQKQKQFIYDASHELKTPIVIIGASVETLEKSPKEKKWLTTIKSENERMNQLVVSLLDLSKSENIKETEKYINVNLSKLIENKALSFESLMFENNLELITNIESQIMFNCNGDRIKELLSILIDNAIKHSLKDSKIMVNLKKDKKDIILSVTNTGEEIPEEEREKIFERFYRIDKSRNRKENRYGLGLSIARNIVTNHNGTIKVDCKNGNTTFIVNFKEN